MKSFAYLALVFFCAAAKGDQNQSYDLIPPSTGSAFVDDMKLTPEQKLAIYGIGSNNKRAQNVTDGGHRRRRAAIRDVTKRWNNGIIPYVIDCSLDNMPSALAAIQAAITEWESMTCLRFVKRDGHKNVLTFFRDTHCWAHVGDGGNSHVSVGPRCDYQHVMVHEIGHAVGFYHEHNRPDRDTYVDVIWSNIQRSLFSAFTIEQNADITGFKYDYGSIMHYPWTSFSTNNQATIKPKMKTTDVPYTKLSSLDAKQIAKMYNCPNQHRGRRRVEEVEEEEQQTSNVRSRRATVCVDTDAGCSGWRSHCLTNDFVKKNCKKTCNTCSVAATFAPRTRAPSTACVDTDAGCPGWTSHCLTNDFVKKNCRKTCNTCTGVSRTRSPVTFAPRTRGPITACADTDAGCSGWKSHCLTNDFVKKNCRKTCNTCTGVSRTRSPVTFAPRTRAPTTACVDTDAGCPGWKSHCLTNDFVKKNCRKTCNTCTGVSRTRSPVTFAPRTRGPTTACVDTDAGCPGWTSHCLTNDFVKQNCKKTCNTCSGVSRTRSPVTFAPRTRGPTTGGSCTDTAANCASLKSSCTSEDVRRKCRKTCGMCEIRGPCQDNRWKNCRSKKHECGSSQVKVDCPITCNSCPFARKPRPTGTALDKRLGKPRGNCANPLGLSSSSRNRLPDTAFSTSSTLVKAGMTANAKNGRLNFREDQNNGQAGAWCAVGKQGNSYLQVDLGSMRKIAYIATQGRDSQYERVTKYTVSYSTNGSQYKTIQSNGRNMVFDGNCDHFTPIVNRFPSQISARYIRVHPVEFNYPCLRMELYGC